MFDLTSSPEFMAALEKALVEAARRAGIALGGSGGGEDPKEVWLTTQETLKYLRWSYTAFVRWKKKRLADGSQQGDKLRVTTSLGGTEPRYQLASLQAVMREKAVGGPGPELPFADGENGRGRRPAASNGGKVRGVVLRMPGTRTS